MRGILIVVCILVVTGFQSHVLGDIKVDAGARVVDIVDGGGKVRLRLRYDGRCLIDRMEVQGREVVAEATGICSAVKVGGVWYTTREGVAAAEVEENDGHVTIRGIRYGPAELPIAEEWAFEAKADEIEWRITRTYAKGGTLEDTYFPGFDFKGMETWTGGLLDTGGVIWGKYLDTPVATYGSHARRVRFWSKKDRDGLEIATSMKIEGSGPPTAGGEDVAARFSRHPSGVFSASFWGSAGPLEPANGLARFLADRQNVWKPTVIEADGSHPLTITMMVTLRGLAYEEVAPRGTFEGVDGEAVGELLNTVARYGVIDRGISGSNGWRTSFICTHEPWIAQLGLAVADPDLVANYTRTLDEIQKFAIKKDGRVLGRWHNDAGDAMEGTFDPATGYYEAQWGYMLDSQPSYVICVGEQFDLTGDVAWLRSHRDSCRAALEYMIRRDSDQDGLLEVIPQTHKEEKGSDWIDIVWASHENALVNAEMYEAMKMWGGLEALMGDEAAAGRYLALAQKLKAAFNRPVDDGGFWNPERKWYVYWREPDGSIHGDNFVTPVNFAAIAYGICDDSERAGVILDEIERLTAKEGLFHWPLCFYPYKPEEVYLRQKVFPEYENGDLFLGWAELAIRAYVKRDPKIAMKYVHKVLERYEKDGLSFQRYLRTNAEGSGDDILANNAMAIVGLYRDIYGVRPRHDRLHIEPHLTAELVGTVLRYPLRGVEYSVELGKERISIGTGGAGRAGGAVGTVVSCARPFGVDFRGDRVAFFPGLERGAELVVERGSGSGVEIGVEAWPASGERGVRRWTLRSTEEGKGLSVRHRVSGLKEASLVRVARDGRAVSDIRATKEGTIEFVFDGVTGKKSEVWVEVVLVK